MKGLARWRVAGVSAPLCPACARYSLAIDQLKLHPTITAALAARPDTPRARALPGWRELFARLRPTPNDAGSRALE